MGQGPPYNQRSRTECGTFLSPLRKHKSRNTGVQVDSRFRGNDIVVAALQQMVIVSEALCPHRSGLWLGLGFFGGEADEGDDDETGAGDEQDDPLGGLAAALEPGRDRRV